MPASDDDAEESALVVEGARTHNLKSVSVTIPHRSLTVVTGVSGSGKTSLAFDTIFAEGQRRFVESLSTYARRFLGRLDRAPVERITGLAPAIAIDSKSSTRSLRSTVATATEVYDYLRLLWARIGHRHCPTCDAELMAHAPSTAAAAAVKRYAGETVSVLAPLWMRHVEAGRLALADRKAAPALLAELKKNGFTRVVADGVDKKLDGGAVAFEEELHLSIDRVALSRDKQARLAESLEHAYRQGSGIAALRRANGDVVWFTREPACVPHGIFEGTEELTPRLFSFNSWQGACPRCFGLGETRQADPVLLVRRPDLPLFGEDEKSGAQSLFFRGSRVEEKARKLAGRLGADLDRPFRDLPDEVRQQILQGSPDSRNKAEFPGLLRLVEEACADAKAPGLSDEFAEVLRDDRCPECNGARLAKRALRVKVRGKNIAEACGMTVEESLGFFDEKSLDLDRTEALIAKQVIQEIRNRLHFLVEVGLDYLTLDRTASTLSGGEAQRIRLATQIGNRLVGVLYVLDEPTVGLHPRDVDRLLKTLEALRDLGNTLVVVEHDEASIRRADHVVDMGPGAGHRGGEVVFSGSAAGLVRCPRSLTARYLNGVDRIPTPDVRRKGNGEKLVVRGARAHNLKNVDVAIPLGTLTVVSGVSGSGKSSLVMDVIRRGVNSSLLGAPLDRALADRIDGLQSIRRLVVVDQSPIGRTPSSNPATYTGAFEPIRELFATLPVSRVKGFTASRFSFNTGEGRCAACSGRGAIRVEMHFLSDVWITCESCRGRRYNDETLRVEFQGKTIADVLDLEVREAILLFANVPRIVAALRPLDDVGLGYLKLGQPAPTLSSGEAQRVRLASELGATVNGGTLYLLDEPTTGLHFADVHRLVEVLQRLVDAGNTVIAIEHHLDVVRSADWVVDLGPEGGDAGGEVVAVGTPESIARVAKSKTGRYLKPPRARKPVRA
ncbi:MAG: excinuclease ABC subunit UvrA [Planctomycetes bacterium]|nr:excinuclease ABC subunit UvrA [Planctomycetota bacterium]